MKRGERRRRKQNDQNIPNNRHQPGSIFFLLTSASGPFLSANVYEFISQMFLELNICLWLGSSPNWTRPSVVTGPRPKATPFQTAHIVPLYSTCRGRVAFLPRVYFVILMTHHGVSFLSACWTRHKGGGGRADNIHIAIETKNMQKRLKALRTQVVSFRDCYMHLTHCRNPQWKVLFKHFLKCLKLSRMDTPIMISNCTLRMNVPEIFLEDPYI